MNQRWRIGLNSACIGILVVWPWGGEDVPLLTPEELAVVETGSFVAGPSPGDQERQAFTVTAWNIHYGKNYEKVRDALTSVLRSDVLLLQEVDRMTSRTRDRKSGSPRDVPVLLARELGMNYAYGIEFQELKQDGKKRPAFTGQQTLSSYPMRRYANVHFEHQLADWSRGWLGFWQKRNGGRMFLYTQVQISEAAVHLYNVHLESRAKDSEKIVQVGEILAHFEEHVGPNEPVVIAGDLNTRESEESPVVRVLVEKGFTDPLPGHTPGKVVTNHKEDKRLDWIFSRNLVSVRASVAEDFLGSNHRAVSVTYRLPGGEGTVSETNGKDTPGRDSASCRP